MYNKLIRAEDYLHLNTTFTQLQLLLKSTLEWMSFNLHHSKTNRTIMELLHWRYFSRAQVHYVKSDAPGVNAYVLPGNEFLLESKRSI